MKLNSLALKAIGLAVLPAVMGVGLTACSDDVRTDGYATWDQYEFPPLSEAQKQVIDAMPKNVIIAHRGSEFWAPEESEAAMRWARNMGADYIECDLQMTKDGVVLALHDTSLIRTTNVSLVYPNRKNDYTSTFTFEELLKLDIGSWFNDAHPAQGRQGFVGQDMLCIQDVLAIAEGKRIKRNADGTRVIERDENGNYLRTVYEDDPYDNGNRPGVYIETKSPSLFKGVEAKLYQILKEEGWYNEDPSKLKPVVYKDGVPGEVRIQETTSRVILQTFENDGLDNLVSYFPGIPILYLCADYTQTPARTAELITFAVEHGATIYGPNIKYASASFSSINLWQLKMVRKAGLPIHCWTFETNENYLTCCGPWSDVAKKGETPDNPVNCVDGGFTNLTDMGLRFYKETLQAKYLEGKGINYFISNESVRKIYPWVKDNLQEDKTLRDPQEVLEALGYAK